MKVVDRYISVTTDSNSKLIKMDDGNFILYKDYIEQRAELLKEVIDVVEKWWVDPAYTIHTISIAELKSKLKALEKHE